VRASDAPIMPDVLLRVISDESSPASAKVDAYGGLFRSLLLAYAPLPSLLHLATLGRQVGDESIAR